MKTVRKDRHGGKYQNRIFLLLLLMAVVPLLIAGSDAGIGQPPEAGYGCNTDKGKFVCRKEKESYGSDIE